MEHAHDELTSAGARAGLANGGGQPRRASVPLPEPRSGLLPAAESIAGDDAQDDEMPALIMGQPASPPFSWARPPPHPAHGSPTRPRRMRVASFPLSSATTIWVSPETYRLTGRARGTGVSPHASAADNGTAPADDNDIVELTVGFDPDSPAASLGGSRDNPIGVVPYEAEPRPLIVDSLERVGADCLHRYNALRKDGKALCYICQDSLLEHPVLEDEASLPSLPQPAGDQLGIEPPVVRAFPCRHLFHEVCLAPWLLGHTTCPTCRFDAASSGLDDEVDEVDIDTDDERGLSGGTIGRLIGAIHDLSLGTSSVSPEDATTPAIHVDGGEQSTLPAPFALNWSFPDLPSRPQTPPNTLRPTPEGYRTPSLSPQLPFRARTPEASFPERLSLADLELAPDGSFGTLYIADDQLPESFLRPFEFGQTVREALSSDVELELPPDLIPPEQIAQFAQFLHPTTDESWVHVRDTRRASVPVAAVQPDKPFSEWLNDREREQ
ncbi:hypothetical protein EXIGLDRAFT_833899 [Exidia glandulosa HHB12029]|uniref:RING-type domain-containing protein n=1 Tax=Exidia glandulosa HHB12029 TaxID=1314781 RepID=A0A165KCE4_EXIGL|nr:hypothetical protein EXIGLDRAFT_833899 [Exidia glandulosa HHB12029]